jgi:hypothetical protein
MYSNSGEPAKPQSWFRLKAGLQTAVGKSHRENFSRYSLGDMCVACLKANQKLLAL